MADFTVRQGDDFTIADTLKDASGNPVDIQATAITFTLIPLGGGAPVLNAVTAQNLQVGNGSDGSKGKVSYTGGGATTATPGKYLASWYNATTLQTFPNGGYILFQVTADAPVGVVTRFAESTDLEARLGIELTADEHIRAAALLEAASKLIQDVSGQTIALVTDDTLTIRSVYGVRFTLPQRPVVSIASITFDGTLVEPGVYYLDGDEVVQLNFRGLMDSKFTGISRGWLGPAHTLSIVYTHGYASIPGIVKSICMEAVVRVWVNPGAVIEETVGNTRTMYSMRSGTETPTGLLLTPDEKRQLNELLRRQSGSVTLR